MTTFNPADDTPADVDAEIALIDLVLADMGTLHRRATAETLSGEDLRQLVNRARLRLKLVRAARQAEAAEAAPIELTDKARAYAAAAEVAARLAGALRLLRHFRMKPRRKPAGTLALPFVRLKAMNRSQIACVSTFQQGRALFADLISSAQHVRKTLGASSMLICPENIVL